jgi:hypothetical protein
VVRLVIDTGGKPIYPVPYIIILGPPLINLVLAKIGAGEGVESDGFANIPIILPPTYIIFDPPVVVIGFVFPNPPNIKEPGGGNRPEVELVGSGRGPVFFLKYTSLDILRGTACPTEFVYKAKLFHIFVVLPLIWRLNGVVDNVPLAKSKLELVVHKRVALESTLTKLFPLVIQRLGPIKNEFPLPVSLKILPDATCKFPPIGPPASQEIEPEVVIV